MQLVRILLLQNHLVQQGEPLLFQNQKILAQEQEQLEALQTLQRLQELEQLQNRL